MTDRRTDAPGHCWPIDLNLNNARRLMMLCLGRNCGQEVILILPTDPVALAKLAGKRIVVTALELRQGGCRIGFTADEGIEILRAELVDSPGGEQRNEDRAT